MLFSVLHGGFLCRLHELLVPFACGMINEDMVGDKRYASSGTQRLRTSTIIGDHAHPSAFADNPPTLWLWPSPTFMSTTEGTNLKEKKTCIHTYLRNPCTLLRLHLNSCFLWWWLRNLRLSSPRSSQRTEMKLPSQRRREVRGLRRSLRGFVATLSCRNAGISYHILRKDVDGILKSHSSSPWLWIYCSDLYDAERCPHLIILLICVWFQAGTFTVANLYYSHPILNILAEDFGVTHERASLIPTAMQAGYAAGLLFLCPLGDIFRRRAFVLILVWFTATIVSAEFSLLLLFLVNSWNILMADSGWVFAWQIISLCLLDYRSSLQ